MVARLMMVAMVMTTSAVATPPPFFSPPVFSASTGSYFLNVTAPSYQAGVTKLEVLLPPKGLAGHTAAVVLALPVEAGGTSTRTYGSAIELIRAAGWHSRHNIAVVTPSFSTTPWFGDRGGNSTKPPVRQEAFILDVIVPWILAQRGGRGGFGRGEPTLGGNISLVGFSKSGWGAFSLIARNPQVFDRAAVWDAPTMLGAAFCNWLVAADGTPVASSLAAAAAVEDLWDMMEVFGDCATWSKYAPVELLKSFSSPATARAALDGRLWLGGQHYFGDWPLFQTGKATGPAPGAPFNHTVDFHALLLALGVRHTYNDNCDPGRHQWSWVWLQKAMNSLLPPQSPPPPPAEVHEAVASQGRTALHEE